MNTYLATLSPNIKKYAKELVEAYEYSDYPTVRIPAYHNEKIIEALQKTAKYLVPASTISLTYESEYSIEATIVIK